MHGALTIVLPMLKHVDSCCRLLALQQRMTTNCSLERTSKTLLPTATWAKLAMVFCQVWLQTKLNLRRSLSSTRRCFSFMRQRIPSSAAIMWRKLLMISARHSRSLMVIITLIGQTPRSSQTSSLHLQWNAVKTVHVETIRTKLLTSKVSDGDLEE